MARIIDLVPIPKGINEGIQPAGNRAKLSILGNPRANYGAECAPVTNPALKKMMVTQSVGPFRVTGYGPAVEMLESKIMPDIKREAPEVYAALGTAGMLCARLVRGSRSAISNHSWGDAIDLTVAGALDVRGNNRVQYGLTLIAPIFNSYGWFWGAGFGVEDGMHFECGLALIQKLAGAKAPAVTVSSFDVGDRGPQVAKLQARLRAAGQMVDADGVFGPGTRAALVAFQASNGLKPDGIAGKTTLAALGVA